VQLYGYGESDGHLYYAMELVEGTSLEQELTAGRRYGWREATQIGIDIARALKHAHDHGVIHRDLKPGNLLVDAKDRIKLTDFGIAKLFGATRMTSGGNVMGTADYMAPEQAAGDVTTPRCDLYSLGCVMYALLAGRPPFVGASIAEVVHKVRYEQPDPVTRYAADVPRELEQILAELLSKDPEDRIRTALSLTHRLRSIMQALSISTTERSDFSSDETSEVESQTARIVNPPPDIAVRPTVCLPKERDLASAHGLDKARISRKDQTGDHFTLVESDRRWSEGRNESSVLSLVLLLLLVVGGLMAGYWYSSRPPSADLLHQRITSTIDPTNNSTLLEARADVKRFLASFPDDVRAVEIKGYEDDISRYERKRLLERRARGRPATGTLSPIEDIYLEALRQSDKNLDRAIATMTGLIYLYENEEDTKTRHIVENAKEELADWNGRLEKSSEDHIQMLQERMQLANRLLPDHPDKAKKIWEGVMIVYAERLWAKSFVENAAECLQSLKRKQTSPDAETDNPPQPSLAAEQDWKKS
jgi:serine/threonine-protein kinase